MKYKQGILSAGLAVVLAACGPSGTNNPEAVGGTGGGAHQAEILGVVKVDFQHIGQADFSVNATMVPFGTAPQTLARTAAVSFTQGARGSFIGPDHARYLYGQLDVNNTGAARSNLTLLGINAKVSGGFQSLGDTSLTTATRVSGTPLTALEARQVWPMHRRDLIGGAVQVVNDQADFQAYREADITPAIANYMAASPYNGYAFPFGFMARSKTNANSRVVPVGTAAGTVTLAFRYADANPGTTDDLSSFSWTGLITADSENRVTVDPFEADTTRACTAAQTLYGASPVILATLRNVATINCGRTNTTAQDVATVRTSGPGTAPTSVQPEVLSTEPGSSDLIPAAEISASIDASQTPPTTFAGGEVAFSGAGSVGNDLSYKWDFGDGASATSDPGMAGDAVHTYDTPGYYTARLTVTDAPTSTVKTAEYRIAILPDVNDLPSSRFVDVNSALAFDVKYPLPNLTYEWNFSDGTVLQGPAVTKPVSQGGFTTYTLDVYDGTLDEDGQRHIVAQDEGRYNAALPPLNGSVLEIISSGVNISAFRAYFYFPNDGTNVQMVSYDWNFGDGQRQTTTTSDVEHHYVHTGNYAVTLIATDNYGRQATVRHALVRQNSLGINFHLQACLNELVGTCQWPQAPAVPPQCPSNVGETPLIRCQSTLTPQSVPMTAQSQTGFSANLPNLLPTAGTQVLARFYPVDGSPVVETGFGPLTSGENVLSVDGNTASVYAFDGLRVPDYVVNILPNEQFDFMAPAQEPLQYRDRLGVVRLLQIVNIPERQVSADDRISFVLPIYAIDKNGALLDALSGKLYAHLKGDGGQSYSTVDLVNGVGQMRINASVADIQAGKVTPGNVEILPPSCYNEVVNQSSSDYDSCKSKPDVNATLPNYYCSVYYAGEYDSYYTYGCATLVASSEVPTGLISASPVIQLFANGVTAQSATGTLHALVLANTAMLNHVNLGATGALRKALDSYLKKFDGSATQFVVGFIPLVGSGSDLLIQAYTYGTTGKADPVIVTFGVVGIAFDVAGVLDFETTLPAAETVKGLVGVYKIGGPFTKEAVKGLAVVLKGGVTPAEAYTLLKGSASFMADAAKAGVNPAQLRDSLEAALKLAQESTGNAFNGLKLFSKSYSDLRAAGAFSSKNLSFLNKMNVAKYGMFSPETAKILAGCGSDCLSIIVRYSEIVSKSKNILQSTTISDLNSASGLIKDSSASNSFKTGLAAIANSGCARGVIKSLSLEVCGKLAKRLDGMFEVSPSKTNLERWKRLNVKDTATGMFHPGEAAAAAQLESVMGGILDRVPTPLTGKSPDFKFISGDYSGKTIDLMYTIDDFTSGSLAGINREWSLKQSKKIANIVGHLKKADYVVMDTRNFSKENVDQLIIYINKAISDPANGLKATDFGRIVLIK